MALNSALQAAEDKNAGIQSEFIIVSGDRDLYSAVSKIVERGFPVHVWSWKNGLASVYTSQQDELIDVHLLDDHLEEIGFRETTFRIDRSTISPHSIVILDPLPKADKIKDFISDLKIPVCRYVFPAKRADASSQDLVVIPAFAWSMSHEELTNPFQESKSKLETHGLKVMTYFEYRQQNSTKSSKDELAISNQFQELSLSGRELRENVQDTSDRHGKDGTDDNGFNAVNHRSEQRRTFLRKGVERSRNPCMWGKYCDKESQCNYGHTKDEEKYFKAYGHKKARKYKLCQNDNCMRGNHCAFAHGKEELLCPTCDRTGVGHSVGECILVA